MIGREKEKSLDPPLRAGIILIPDPDQKAARLKKQNAAGRSIMFTIGEFSRICQVSIKTLRHYDKVGLLKPAKVDALTGYRYYSQRQLEVMLLIQRLKRYGFPLEEIRGMLNGAEEKELFSKLLRQKEKLLQQRQETDQILKELTGHLRDFERTGDIMGYQKKYEIQLVEAPERNVIASRQKMGVDEFGRYYEKLYKRVPEEKVTPNGMVGAVYYDEEFDRECSDIELVLGIREKEKADRIIESGLCARTVHKGAYSTLSEAYAALVTWIKEQGYQCNGAPYEFYLKTQFDGLSPEEWETEIYFPIERE